MDKNSLFRKWRDSIAGKALSLHVADQSLIPSTLCSTYIVPYAHLEWSLSQESLSILGVTPPQIPSLPLGLINRYLLQSTICQVLSKALRQNCKQDINSTYSMEPTGKGIKWARNWRKEWLAGSRKAFLVILSSWRRKFSLHYISWESTQRYACKKLCCSHCQTILGSWDAFLTISQGILMALVQRLHFTDHSRRPSQQMQVHKGPARARLQGAQGKGGLGEQLDSRLPPEDWPDYSEHN